MSVEWWPRLRNGRLAAYLEDAEAERLEQVLEVLDAAPGVMVLNKGESSASLLIVEDGEVEVIDEATGETIVLAIVGPGGVVGEVGFLDGLPRTHAVRARSACRLGRLTRERFLAFAREDGTLFAKIAIALGESLAERFRSVAREIEPMRAFAVSLREPEESEATRFDEIDEPLPEAALQLIEGIVERAGKGSAGA